VVGLLQLI